MHVEVAMHVISKAFLSILSLGLALLIGTCAATAQKPGPQESIALKSGETVELGNVFWVVNCRSLLTGPPVAEVLEGPPEVTATVRVQNVIPRKMNCANEVSGGMLLVTAPKEIKERTQGILTIRLKYPTKDGERQASRQLIVTLFP
jgi:hypothetical protein